jgi:hypothetical protein
MKSPLFQISPATGHATRQYFRHDVVRSAFLTRIRFSNEQEKQSVIHEFDRSKLTKGVGAVRRPRPTFFKNQRLIPNPVSNLTNCEIQPNRQDHVNVKSQSGFGIIFEM